MKNRFRILFLTQLPPPVHGSAVISKIIVESKAITESFHPKLIALHFAKSMRDLGSLTFGKIIKMFQVALQINRTIRTFRPHVVYFTISPKGFSFYRDVFYVAILKLYRSSIVFHLHVKGLDEESEKSFIKLHLFKYVFRNTYVITLSKYLVSELTFFYSGTAFIINNGIYEVPESRQVLRSKKSQDQIQLLYLSNLMRAKGIFVFLEAILWLSRMCSNFTVRIIVSPADVTIEELQLYIRENQLGDIIVLDMAVYGKEKHDAFREADIFIHPTLNDAFPLVILEAMQFQLPVISTYEGAIPDIVAHGITGYLVPKNNAIALGEKVLHLIQNGDERLAMGTAGRQRFLKHYTTDRMETGVRNVLLQVASRMTAE